MDDQNASVPNKKVAVRWLIRETVGNLILVALLFGIVGRLDWWNGWAMSAVYLLWSIACIVFILPVNPQMLAERSRPQKGSKRWDAVLVAIMGVFMLAAYVLACLDVRLGWSPALPGWVQIAGAVFAVLGYDFLVIWSMAANAFFSAIVRIQSNRQHTVATGGPYRFVRHPGYVGTILFHLAAPFLLNSRWALIPAVLAAGTLVLRTALEDRTLQAELPGYKEYAGRVRYRLLPGIW